MLFNTLNFALFFAIVLAGNAALRKHLRLQNALLLVASAAFYAAWDARFLALIFGSTLLDFCVGRALDQRMPDGRHTRSARTRRGLLILSLVGNLGALAFFKYFGFFVESACGLAGLVGIDLASPALEVLLPVGISFYTFQSLSYTVDIYRGELRSEPSFVRFALFVAFFPQLVAGPIVRAAEFLPQIARPRRVTADALRSATWLICWGLFKKSFAADNLAPLVELGFRDDVTNTGVAGVAVYAFAMQIYCDFSGYTDIARGCARVLGFELPLNFHIPYAAANPVEFWRRWHISLSTWLRDYLYIPLGGSRGSRGTTLRNLLVTMLLGGLWHGAAWTFVLWGAFHGVLLGAHRWLAGRRRGKLALPIAVRRIAFFHLVCLGWVLFRADGLAQAGSVLTSLVSPGWSGAHPESLLVYAAPVVAVDLAQHLTGDAFAVWRLPWPLRTAVYVALWFGLTLLGRFDANDFIYFQF